MTDSHINRGIPRGAGQSSGRPEPVALTFELFGDLVPWLALNRRGLTVFVHPDTGDALADHSAHIIWLGDSRTLNLEALR